MKFTQGDKRRGTTAGNIIYGLDLDMIDTVFFFSVPIWMKEFIWKLDSGHEWAKKKRIMDLLAAVVMVCVVAVINLLPLARTSQLFQCSKEKGEIDFSQKQQVSLGICMCDRERKWERECVKVSKRAYRENLHKNIIV